MLISCPECKHQVSAVVLACASCGYLFDSQTLPTPVPVNPAASAELLCNGDSESSLWEQGRPDTAGAGHQPVNAYASPSSGPEGFEPAPRERFWRRMGRYVVNAVLLVAAQLSANALVPLTGVGQYVTPVTLDVLQSLLAMPAWWLWVCKTRPAVHAAKARYIPGAREAAVLMAAQAVLAWLPCLLGDHGFLLSTYWGTGPIIDTTIWLALAGSLLLGRPGMRDVAALHSWFRTFLIVLHYLLDFGRMSFVTKIPGPLVVAVVETNLGLLLLLGGSPSRARRYAAVGIFLASEIAAVAIALTTPPLGVFPPY